MNTSSQPKKIKASCAALYLMLHPLEWCVFVLSIPLGGPNWVKGATTLVTSRKQ